MEGRILEEVNAVRQLRAGRLPRPLPLKLEVEDGVLPGLTSVQVAVRLRQAVRERGLDRDVQLVRPHDTGPAVLVSVVRNNGTVVRAALPSDLASLRVILPEDLYRSQDLAGQFMDDVLTAVAFVVERSGATGAAARLLEVSAEGSILSSMLEVALTAASVMAEQGLARPASRLAMRSWSSDDADDRDLGDFYYWALLDQINELSTGDRIELVEAMRRRAATEETFGDPRRAGTAHYNLARCLGASNRTTEALDEMDATVELDLSYGGREYFFRERGGMRWDLGRHGEAADDYRRALSLSGDPGELVPLLADALLYAGRYAEAERALDGWSPSGHDLDRLAVLVRVVVAELRAVTGIDVQNRSSAVEPEIDAVGDEPAALIALLGATDALDPRIWMRLIDEGHALPRLVLVAQMALNSAAGWALATVAALVEPTPPESELVQALIASGHRLSDSPFTEAVEDVLAHVEDAAVADMVRTTMYDALDRLNDKPAPITVRFPSD